ncbi:BQ2448_7412 [Microbotryum intermedium]|uniref:BQ2448_7412 protein n=1 Tax=Microbotryum intermedium TaxID=269621 RepID=A0A238FQY1_9BASI|nr:BQ2448_7412 [Microbotryum intermedium]
MSTELPDVSSGASTVAGAASRLRSQSLSMATELPISTFAPQNQHALLLPIPMIGSGASSNATPSSPPMAALSPPTSPLSASLRAFSILTLSPPTTLDSEEFQKALSHARRASFSNSGARPIVVPDDPASNSPGMSGSPTSSAFSDQLLTPSSSPQQTPLNPNIGIGLGTKAKIASIKGGALGGVCEKDELALADEDEDGDGVDPRSGAALSSSALFADGAKWGWPQSSKSGTSSPPGAVVAPSAAASHNRRASGPTLIPLGRVVSAGAGPPPAATSTSNGLGLFRRLSVGGFGSKPKAPSPPASANPLPLAANVAPTSLSPTDARSSAAGDESRGRKSLGPSKSTKRKISPFGERMLHGMHH